MASIRDLYVFLHRAPQCIHQHLVILARRIGVGIAAYHKGRYGDPRSIEEGFCQIQIDGSPGGPAYSSAELAGSRIGGEVMVSICFESAW